MRRRRRFGLAAGESADLHRARRMQRVHAGHLELLERIVHEHRVREGAGLDRGRSRPRPRGPVRSWASSPGGRRPATGLALQEDQQRAGSQFTSAQSEQQCGAHAFGGFGLHAHVLERQAQVEVQHRIVGAAWPAPAGTPGSPRHGAAPAAARSPATPSGHGRAAAPQAGAAGSSPPRRARPRPARRATRACRPGSDRAADGAAPGFA